MHRKHLLLLLILFAGYLVAGENSQVSTIKAKPECNLEKLFEKLPQQIASYILQFAVNPLNRETTFEKLVFRKSYYNSWFPVGVCLLSAKTSTIGEYTYFSEISGGNRKRETKPHESVTKRLIENKFYKKLALKQ